MDIQTLWIIVLSIATPIAGVIGFAIQLRQVKKTHLENEKLLLEIRILKEKAAESDQRIVKATNKEVLEVNHVRTYYSLESRRSGIERSAKDAPPANYKAPLKEKILAIAAVSGLALVAVYLIFDIYRLVIWVSSKL